MIIKKYKTKTMKEALTRAKYELGSEAILVSQRTVKEGKWFNPIKKEMLEVTFALEDKPLQSIEEDLKEQEIVYEPEIGQEEDLDQETSVDPFYKHSGPDIKMRLENYCKLHNKNDFKLTSQERRDFFGIVLKGSAFGSKKELSKINVLVGPTGVGKTTTIAKLAAIQQLGSKKKVGLLTMDTYRIGAVQQLKTYADILQVPFHVVNTPDEMKQKLDLIDDCDIIFVDTLGTSPRDMKKLIEIKKSLNAMGEGISTYLVLSISTDRDSIDSILQRYKMLSYDALVITKIDEMENTRNFWHIAKQETLPVQYFCHGQEVPEDIKEATPENLFKYFEENFNHDGSGWKTKKNS